MRMRALRVVLISCTLFILLDMLSCRIFDEVMVPVEADGLIRASIDTPSGIELSYLAAITTDASGQRIIYVHGTPGSARAFERYLLDPIDGFESISVDRPGFGRTLPHDPEPRLREQARAIEPLLVERNGKWPILVGHSLGAPIVARVAADFPDRVGGLLILSGSLDPALERITWYQRLGNFAFIPYMIPRALRNANRELFPLKKELVALKPLLRQIRCPVIIVHAPDDSLVPFQNVAFMEAHMSPGVVRDVVVLEGKNHFLPWNSEDSVRSAIVKLAKQPTPIETVSPES